MSQMNADPLHIVHSTPPPFFLTVEDLWQVADKLFKLTLLFPLEGQDLYSRQGVRGYSIQVSGLTVNPHIPLVIGVIRLRFAVAFHSQIPNN